MAWNLQDPVGCNFVQADSGSSETVQICPSEDHVWNEAAATYSDCFATTAMTGEVVYNHCCPREANESAHGIARLGFILNL